MRLNKFCFLSIITFLICFSVLAQKPRKPIRKKITTQIDAGKKTASSAENNSSSQSNTSERLVEISTDYGVMVAKLYDSTPLHRDNFIKLVGQKFYDSLLFHRIINQFMIQGGDPSSKNAADGQPLGGGAAPGDRVPAEFKSCFFHKKGALAAARDDNPEKQAATASFILYREK